MDLRTLRVDQNGSLVRPEPLLDAFDRHAHGRASDAELRAAQDEAVRAVIKKQEAVGLPVVSDGEFRRRNFQESFGNAVSGYDASAEAATRTDWREPNRPFHRTEQNFDAAGPAITTRRPAVERLRLKHNVILDEYRFAASVAARPAKVSLIGPDRIAQRFDWAKSQNVYKDVDEFTADVVAIQRQMIKELIDAGCRYVHIDAPGFTAYVDQVSLDRMRARGEDPDKNLARGIAAENAVIAGFEGVTFGLHICRGNPRGTDASGKIMPQWHREGHYDSIAERLFGGLKHHRLLLEYDSERAGDFTPLRFIPKDKIAVLGLVTTKSSELESKDALKRRIDDAARHLPLEQLALSPQCGFNSGGDRGLQLGEDEQWRKFERILETAREVWG